MNGAIFEIGGDYQLCLDPAPCQYQNPPADYPLTMTLPGTTAQQQIGSYNDWRADGLLSEKYPFAGQIWLRKTVTLTPAQCRQHCLLYLERTRMTQLWVNGHCAGSETSLCTPHIYDITPYLAEQTELVLCIRNTDYPTPGGHMTSPDTQTNWIGVTGRMLLEFHDAVSLSDLQAFPDPAAERVTVKGILHGTASTAAEVTVQSASASRCHTLTLNAAGNGTFSVEIPLMPNAPRWSEYDPQMITLHFRLPNGETAALRFGLRDFKACGDHFELNGIPVMLRGKHDALVFPLTGAAPTDLASWEAVCRQLKQWGINHLRFHTCCPPDAAFSAADAAGLFLEPELPFWGTWDAPGGEKYNETEQEYLVREGLRICRAFGNHPSFCLFSLGNELWGSSERLGAVIETLRTADPRPLYTQGSNNFQHMPLQLPQEDFWTGVRTGTGRLLRGSFADCDAPLGRIQTAAPSASWDYEAYLVPQELPVSAQTSDDEAEIDIQYGTGVKRVRAQAQKDALFPTVPVVTHEIGQYNIYPDYREIPHYTGVTAARNLEIFRERLEAAGMGSQAEDFFRCSGAFSRDCYKMEIEAAMRSPHIAGFQLLDLQDFPGQGTALVGMLNALRENKGFLRPEEWRAFCGDLVPLAIFDSYVWAQGQPVSVEIALRSSRPALKAQTAVLRFSCGTQQTETTVSVPANASGLVRLGCITLTPQCIGNARLTLTLPDETVTNTWQLTVLPPVSPVCADVMTARSFSEAEPYLRQGARVLLLPEQITDSIKGFYCTDFWNYHMFRQISESMHRQVPVGTMGLCIDTAHPIAKAMFSAAYSTPQWYSAVTHADCAILDDAPAGFRPTVQMIDNVERNHRLGLLFETAVSGGRLLICTVRFAEAPEDPAMNRLYHAVTDYIRSADFSPKEQLSAAMLRALFG